MAVLSPESDSTGRKLHKPDAPVQSHMCAIFGHGVHLKTILWLNAKRAMDFFFQVFTLVPIYTQPWAHKRRQKDYSKIKDMLFFLFCPSYWALSKKKEWLPSWQECPVMTHAHMHYKAYEMRPILKTVVVQNNEDYCQINRQTSFNENSLCCLHMDGPANPSSFWEELGTCIWGLGWPPSTAALIHN